MSGRRYQAELERVFDAPRALVWAIVADTNRWDHAAGLAPPRYGWLVEGKKNLRLASATELGIALEWVEPPYVWIEGRRVEGERRFRKGPVERGGFDVTLDDAPNGGTHVRAVAWVDAPFVIGVFQKMKFARALERYFDAAQSVLSSAAARAAEEGERDDEPAMTRARRLIDEGPRDATPGPGVTLDPTLLATRKQRLRGRKLDEAIVDRLVEYLAHTPDDDVASMKPFELARGWRHDKREVLRTFLHATEAGLTDLRWQINCPVCKVGAGLASHLGELGETQHCGACRIDYDIDFARHVEAVFTPNEALRRVEPKLYCASSPAFLPHVFAQLRAGAGTQVEHAADLPLGSLLVRSLWASGGEEVEILRRPSRIVIDVDDDGLSVRQEGGASSDEPTVLALHNRTKDEVAVLLERSSWSSDAVLGTVIASMPEFSGLFATEAPASGVELRVGHIALLFSDLVGSTALYERVGDARAFAIVEDHFRLMSEIIGRHGGGVVKTMGDAVMASFPSLAGATAAGLEMISEHDAKHGGLGLGVKLGAYAGPCLVVRANERLDYFGTTVNIAARLQAQAAASQLVLTEEQAAEPSIAPIVEHVERTRFEAKLKGIAAEQKLVAVCVASGGA